MAVAFVLLATVLAGLSGTTRARAAGPTTAGMLAGFSSTVLAQNLRNPSVLAFAPNGDIWVGEQAGAIVVYHAGAVQPTPVITLTTDANSELGLLGLAFDPSFATNGYIYVSYTTQAAFTRLSRFTVVNGVASPSSELVLLQGPQAQTQFGPGNDLAVGPDGKLWWSVGGNPYPWGNSQDLDTIYGKIIRLNLDGTTPPDNPYLNVPGAVPGAYAVGLRNPFRFTFLPNGQMMAADTGSNYWEELDIIQPGANYGWPLVEGDCFSCGYVNPVYAYGHLPTDGAISAITDYTGSTFPTQYDNDIFIGDYNRRDIEAIGFDPTYHTATSDTVFDSQAGTISDLHEGPDGNLYFVSIYDGTLSEITPTGPFPPTAVASASPNAGMGPLLVQFSSAGSSDPYGNPLTYTWDFGDGTPTDNTASPTHLYLLNGTYTVTLTVSNGSLSASTTTTVVVGESPPSASITSPTSGSTYNAGQTIVFSGTATDPVDGTLPPSAYTWRVDYYVNGVLEPFWVAEVPGPFYGPVAGVTSGSFQVPADVSQTPNSYYQITLSVVDSSGLTSTTTSDITPNLTNAWTATSNVPGAAFVADGTWQTSSYSPQDVTGVTHVLTGVPLQTVNSQRYRFQGWADGSALTDTFSSSTTSTTYTADYEPSQTTLPAPWQSADIGAPLLSGAADWAPASQSFYIDGSGVDEMGTNDQSHYVYQTSNGDVTLVARIRYQTPSDPWAKAGLMIRQSTAAGSAYVDALITPDISATNPNINGVGCNANGCNAPLPPVTPPIGNGVRMEYTPHNDISPATQPTLAEPNEWLKLQRSGNTFTSWSSPDGMTWTLIGSVSLSMSGPVTAGLFVTSHNIREYSTAAFDNVQVTIPVTPPPCPAPWTCADIGSPTPAGSSTMTNGAWSISGGGADIFGTSDQFQYVSQGLSGDGAISAHITAQGNTGPWAKAGVMLRGSNLATAPEYSILATPGNGTVVQYRATQGGASKQIAQLTSAVLPEYLQVARNGTTFSAYTSPDGSTWTLVPNSPVSIPSMTGPLLQGLAVTSHKNGSLSTVAMDTVVIGPAGPPPPPPCPPPWTCGGVGSPSTPGNATLTNGVWSITGAGNDIWNASDQFEFVSQTSSGASISAHVTSQSNTNSWAKAGVMLRLSTAANAPEYSAFITPGNGISVQYRSTAGGPSALKGTITGTTVPIYLKVTRTGTSFSAYSSTNGISWTLIPGSTVTIASMSGTLLEGLAVTSHASGSLCSVTMDSVQAS